ncbi:MAG: D-alanine--D-alanine ligase [Acidimicrobiales bacterium]
MRDIAVVFGGPSPEHDVSVLTGLQAAHELEAASSEGALEGGVKALYWSKTGEWFEVDPSLEAVSFVEGVPSGSTPLRLEVGSGGGFFKAGKILSPKRLGVDVVIVCCHGGPGEDGSLQGALDLAGIPYTGPSAAGAMVGMDKLAFGALMDAIGLPTLPRVALDEDVRDVEFDGPFIVKPRFGGSSIGIEVVDDISTARDIYVASPHLSSRGAVVEPFRANYFDLQVAARTWPEPQLSAIERPLRANGEAAGASRSEILGYMDKYAGGDGMASAPRELPARLLETVEKMINDAAMEIVRATPVRGVARIDFLSDGDDVVVNEVNTIPGSLARYLWIQPALSFRQLLVDLISEATSRPSRHYGSHGADGTVLRGAATIAAKLA